LCALLVAGLFTGVSLLRRLSNGLGTVRFEELPRVFLDFGGLHGVILLFFSALENISQRP
jgi:hypothetical protein